MAWIAFGKTSHIRVHPLVPVAGVFLTFGQLVDKWSTSSWDEFCLPYECSSFHRNKMKEKFLNLIPFGSSQGLSKILSVLNGKSWGFCGSKWRKLSFHVLEGSSLLLTVCLPWRTFSCSEPLLNIYMNNFFALGKKDLWLPFSTFPLDTVPHSVSYCSDALPVHSCLPRA